MSTPDLIRDRLAAGYYSRPDVIARVAASMMPALTSDGGTPAPVRQPAQATPPSKRVRAPKRSVQRA
ncbi:MAG: hypothetical protein AAGF99_12220 [Bacteroidota bacterium]